MRDVDIVEFLIEDIAIDLFSSETAYGRQTIADIDNQYIYLGDSDLNVFAAIHAFETFFGNVFTPEQISEIADSCDV